MKYRATFTGKLKGAIGIMYKHEVEVEAPNAREANLKLYETHDHIHFLKLVELEGPPRLDLVDAVRARIAAGEYHMNTLEGDLATHLTTDALLKELREDESDDA